MDQQHLHLLDHRGDGQVAVENGLVLCQLGHVLRVDIQLPLELGEPVVDERLAVRGDKGPEVRDRRRADRSSAEPGPLRM